MQTNPLVSIIIPHYKHARYIVESVQSALAQEYSNIEVLVVDDCDLAEPAEDALSAVIDNRLKIFKHSSHKGASASRNTAVEHAQGDLILPLDSDDILDSKYLSKTIPLIDADNIGGAYTAVKFFGLEDKIYTQTWSITGILSGESGALICLLYRKKMFEELGGYDSRWHIGEDSDFFLRASKQGWSFKQHPEPLYYYRRHDGSTTAGHSSEIMIELSKNLGFYHKDLFVEYFDEILKSKDARYWELCDEYKHLHLEFHKLLSLYENLENGLRNSPSQSILQQLKTGVSKRVDRVYRAVINSSTS